MKEARALLDTRKAQTLNVHRVAVA